MKIKDILWLAYKDLSGKKVRTGLTIIMVVIGIAAIISLTSLTQGISASIQKSLSSLGTTSIILTSTKAAGFSVIDTSELATLPNVSTVIPILTGSASLIANSQNSSVTVIGITPQGLQQLLGGNVSLYQGAMYQDTVSPASVVGHSVAFPSSTAGRQNIIVGEPATLQLSGRGGSKYTVPIVGILQSYGTAIIPVDTGVITSLSAAESLLHKSSFNTILVKATSTSAVSSLTAQITSIYGSNARVISTQSLAATASSIIGSISALLAGIAGVSLLVAAIGIMNIMLMAVLERTHEIGIMKSIGFKSRDVMIVFLVQSLIIGFVGGAIGIAVGAGGSYILPALLTAHSASSSTTNSSASSTGSGFSSRSSSSSAGGGFSGSGNSGFGGGPTSTSSSSPTLSFTPVFNISTIIEGLVVAMIVSAAAGLYPAWRASRMQPIDALRQL